MDERLAAISRTVQDKRLRMLPISTNRVGASSLGTGEEIRKEKVTPSGTPDSTKLMNKGTAEQE